MMRFFGYVPISVDLKCQSCSQFQKHNFPSQTLPHDFVPIPVLPGGHECEGPKLSFHIPRPAAPVLYKLLLSHLGDKNTNFSLRIHSSHSFRFRFREKAEKYQEKKIDLHLCLREFSSQNNYSPFLHYRLVPSFTKSILEIQVTKNPLRGVPGYLFFQYWFLSAGNQPIMQKW